MPLYNTHKQDDRWENTASFNDRRSVQTNHQHHITTHTSRQTSKQTPLQSPQCVKVFTHTVNHRSLSPSNVSQTNSRNRPFLNKSPQKGDTASLAWDKSHKSSNGCLSSPTSGWKQASQWRTRTFLKSYKRGEVLQTKFSLRSKPSHFWTATLFLMEVVCQETKIIKEIFPKPSGLPGEQTRARIRSRLLPSADAWTSEQKHV